MALEISLQPTYGPSFFRADGRDMFEHRVDARSCIGPREATKNDKANHPKLWAAYQAAQAASEPSPVTAVLEEMPAFLKRKKGK